MNEQGLKVVSHVRLFVGCRFDAATCARLAAWQDALPGMRWLRPETFHVTLIFLGRIPVELLDGLRAALGEVRGRAMTLRTADPGAFRHGRRAVLYAGIAPCEALESLRGAVWDAAAAVVRPKGRGGFVPHIAVGRSHRGQEPDAGQLRAWAGHCRALEPVTLQVPRFELVESVLRPDGAEHHPVEAWELDGIPA